MGLYDTNGDGRVGAGDVVKYCKQGACTSLPFATGERAGSWARVPLMLAGQAARWPGWAAVGCPAEVALHRCAMPAAPARPPKACAGRVSLSSLLAHTTTSALHHLAAAKWETAAPFFNTGLAGTVDVCLGFPALTVQLAKFGWTNPNGTWCPQTGVTATWYPLKRQVGVGAQRNAWGCARAAAAAAAQVLGAPRILLATALSRPAAFA